MRINVFLITVFPLISSHCLAQEKIKMSADSIIDNFIEKIGGNKWRNLNTRIEKGIVEYHENSESSGFINKSSNRSTYYKAPDFFLDYKDSFFLEKSIMCFRKGCNWFYSEKIKSINFFGPGPVKYGTKFPRTEMLEILNLKSKNQVYRVDSLLRVDFKDTRQKNGIQSLYFSIKTGLLVKRELLSNTDVRWEFYFSDFRENAGFIEAYKIELIGAGEPFYTVSIDEIDYNKELDSSMFDPPAECRNYSSSEQLTQLYYPEFFNDH